LSGSRSSKADTERRHEQPDQPDQPRWPRCETRTHVVHSGLQPDSGTPIV
jgi:hypothetical protein